MIERSLTMHHQLTQALMAKQAQAAVVIDTATILGDIGIVAVALAAIAVAIFSARVVYRMLIRA